MVFISYVQFPNNKAYHKTTSTAQQPDDPVNQLGFISLSLSVMGGASASSVCLHILDNGLPHNPQFLSTELLSKVLNCPPSGIGATRLLCDALKTSKYVSSDNSCGIPPESMF